MRFHRYGLALGTALFATVPPAFADNYTLTLFHTNDLHGRTDQYPYLITTLNEAQERFGEGLLLDAGDIFTGTLYFTEFQGQDALEFMNLMGYDAFVPGNHEFDLGDPEQGHQALAAFFAGAEFPILGANLDFSAGPEFADMLGDSVSAEPQAGALYDGMIVEHNGEPIGIFGLSTQDSETISSPGHVTISDYRQAAEAMVASFEEQGVNKIIALTHLGYDSDPSVGNDLLLAEHVEGIDIIIGGHSHTQVSPLRLLSESRAGEKLLSPTVIGQAGEYGQHLGVMQVTFDENGVVVDASGELLAADDREADADAAKRLESYTAEIETLRDTQVGAKVISTLPNPRHGRGDERSVRANETALGNLIADAQLHAAQQVAPDTVMAIQNSGGIREAIESGDVSVGDLIAVQPFGNRLTLLDVTGAELLETFEIALANAPGEDGGFLQVSAGVELIYDSGEPSGERVVSLSVAQEGAMQAIDPERTYTIATNNFTAAGGDGHTVLGAAYEDGRNTIVGNTDWEMLRDYMVERKEVFYQVEGRIADVAQEGVTQEEVAQEASP
ncbi:MULTISPECIES: bifunctional metallophosphatase/5'-nucleotidase [unclassified Halomonas]|uniref:bifunctional metallophosphatase/5'-nucleotidase n=1 Tax=unclassified Halomonas TaxID=2609666 RepID=UPI0004879EE6|nr:MULTISPECIES: 5'-nucleotidase C-terminal domain-containing protein [unclassified Halomonas]NAO97734.1 bifunctional metallophosphatase/5'-nucleotidase [Halomonas sp. MG34]PKH62689.1 bifunctional metallophosphatase/5'-nucleotidase [Halomonas sp. Choline-3u-9]QGQ69138.1 bifunctional metallophosphatase/5'-nucleotidase [Halomonas sp. PA16-9]